jgi:hypothetical protein
MWSKIGRFLFRDMAENYITSEDLMKKYIFKAFDMAETKQYL